MLINQKIKLNAVEDVRDLVSCTKLCQHDVDLSYDRVLIDAKSIMGILAMDLGRELTLSYSPEDHKILRPVIGRFATV
ncbi:MAG: HPr family phosphocarrier protein [Lachnospiraceae bacterium]|nr:HPr family phosphocarrier protein [Lachnospiraceae bacterium]